MKAFLISLILFASQVYAYQPHLTVTVPEVISKNISIEKSDGSRKQKPIHAIRIQVHSGDPLDGWRLYMHADKDITYDLGKIHTNSFPLYWRQAGSNSSFERIYSTKTLLAESVPGDATIFKIEIALDPTWDLEPGDYLANIYFTLESII